MTALVIDNDESTVSQVNAALSPLGYSVSSASDAAAGLEMASNLVPSIMLVNLATPGSNGLELCKSIHGTDHLKEVPIILLTLREGKFDPVYVKLYGIVSFLKKPFNDDALVNLVNEHSTASGEVALEAEPAMEMEAEPLVETGSMAEAAMAAEPEVEAFEETSYAEPEAFTVESFDDSDATMAMTLDESGSEAEAYDAPSEDDGFGDTVTLSDAESDLGELQASFSTGEYAGEETAVLEDASGDQDESFDFGSTAVMDTSGYDSAGAEEEESSWGDTSAGMMIDGMAEGSGDLDAADETWGGMGESLAMSDSLGGGGDDEGFSGTDAFAPAMDESESFDAGGGFDSGGTMAFDAVGEGDFSTGADTGGFDSEGTMAFDAGHDDSGDTDIGGFKASKDTAPSGDRMSGFDDGADEAAWGESGIASAPAAEEQPAAAFDEAEEAFSEGFEDDGGDEWADDLEGTDGFGDDHEPSFESEDAGFESDFLEETPETAADFAGDDQDYTGLFDTEEEQEPEVETRDKKKKKKKGFRKSAPSRSRRVLVLLLLLVIAGGGAFHFREMLPFDITKIPFKMPDINIPFIGKGDADKSAKPAHRTPAPAPGRPEPAKEPVEPEAKAPTPAPELKAEAPAPVAEKPVKAEPKAPTAVKAEPMAPRQETVKPARKEPAPAQKSAATSKPGTYKKGFYYVQFGVFGNSRNASILSSQLNRKGFPTIKRVITNSKGKKLTVVLLDRPYKTQGSAEKKARTITDATGFDTAVYR